MLLAVLGNNGCTGDDSCGGCESERKEHGAADADTDAAGLTEASDGVGGANGLGEAIGAASGSGSAPKAVHRSSSKHSCEAAYRKTKLDGEISLELVEYDQTLRKQHEQRLQALQPGLGLLALQCRASLSPQAPWPPL